MIQMETLIPDAIKAGECLAEIKKRAKHDTGTNVCYFFKAENFLTSKALIQRHYLNQDNKCVNGIPDNVRFF